MLKSVQGLCKGLLGCFQQNKVQIRGGLGADMGPCRYNMWSMQGAQVRSMWRVT